MTMFPTAGPGLCGTCGGYFCRNGHPALPRELRARLRAAYLKEAACEVEDTWLEVRAFERDPVNSLTPGDGRLTASAVPGEIAGSPFVLRIAPWHMAQLREFADWEDGREIGSWIFGEIDGDGGLRVTDLTAPRLDDERSAGSLTIYGSDAVEFEQQLPVGQGLIGHWHFHGDDPEPSEQDIRAWARTAELWRLERFAGVILTPCGGYHAWDASAFITCRDRVERAAIEED